MRCSQTLNPSVKPYGCDNVMGKAIIPFYMLGLGWQYAEVELSGIVDSIDSLRL